MKDYSEVTLGELQDEYEDMLYPFICDGEAYKLIRKGGRIDGGQRYVVGEHGPEQSGCSKEDAQECKHEWVIQDVDDFQACSKCGVLA